MKYLKIVFKNLLRNKITSFIIVIQLVISYYMIISSFDTSNIFEYQKKQINDTMNLDMNKTISFKIENLDVSQEYEDKYNILVDYIKNLDGVQGFGGYDFTSCEFNELSNNKNFLNITKELYKETLMPENIVNVMFFDEAIYNLININITKGRTLTKEDFLVEDNIPLLVGNKFSNCIQIGDELHMFDSDLTYKVVGIIDSSSYWFDDSDYITRPLQKLDDKFISPYINNEKQMGKNLKPGMVNMAKNNKTFYILKDEKNFSTINKKIIKKSNSLGLTPVSNSFTTQYNNYLNEIKEIKTVNLFLSIFVIIMVLAGIISVSISSTLNRKKEFGIRLANGFSTNDIKILVILEIIFMNVIAYIIASTYFYLGMSNHNIYLNIYLYSSIIGIVIILLSSILPLIKISKLHPCELIGGE